MGSFFSGFSQTERTALLSLQSNKCTQKKDCWNCITSETYGCKLGVFRALVSLLRNISYGLASKKLKKTDISKIVFTATNGHLVNATFVKCLFYLY